MADDPRVRFLRDGRTVELLARVEFVDSAGRVWIVPRGAVVNGASIPRFFWRVVGCPFTGKYRNATILHDFHCDVRIAPSPIVHQMFREKMLADGTERWRAWVMWAAVRVFGPRF